MTIENNGQSDHSYYCNNGNSDSTELLGDTMVTEKRELKLTLASIKYQLELRLRTMEEKKQIIEYDTKNPKKGDSRDFTLGQYPGTLQEIHWLEQTLKLFDNK